MDLTNVRTTYFSLKNLYIDSALKLAKYEEMPDGEVYGEIIECPGVWAKQKSKTKCQKELQKVLSDWIDIKLDDNDNDIPVIKHINLNSNLYQN